MKTLRSTLLFIAVFSLFLNSCKEDVDDNISKEKLSGFIQKGPFLNGTSVSVSELDKGMSQSGKVFNTQIKDNQGTFEISNLQLTSPYVELRANGFYFNEVSGLVSTSQITLNALADVTNISSLNVNVITTLEKARVEKLVDGGLSFAEAKKKAMNEILSVFSINKSDIQSSEFLDINKSGEDNAILLAISAVLQGFRSEAELSELLANLSLDMSTDGKLDSETLGTALISHATFLNQSKIRENLEKRYKDLGVTVQVPPFEKYITQFIEKTSYKAISLYTYPETVDGSLNVLNEKNSTFTSGFENTFEFSATIPKGTSLKIKMEYVAGGDSTGAYWGYRWASNTNWKQTDYDVKQNSQYFEVVESGKPSNLQMLFFTGKGVKIRITYFENNDLVATKTRIITVN
jgi:hypothetical protein